MRNWIAAGLAAFAPFAWSAPTPVADRLAAAEQQAQLRSTSLLHGLKWRAIGPIVQGGRVVDVEGDPKEPYTFYALFASGGLWKTVDNGVSFQPLTDGLPTLIGGDMAVDPNNGQRLWLGTGEPNSQRSSYSGLGMYFSADGGKTFTPAGLADADRISRVVVDPSNSDHVCVAVQGRLYSPGGRRGVFCTRDSGKSWDHVLDPKDDWTGASDVMFDPKDNSVVYASLWERSRRPWNLVESGPGSGVYKSTDGGRSFTRLAGFPSGKQIGRIGLSIYPQDPKIIYASVDNQLPAPEADRDLGDRPLSSARLATMSKSDFLAQDPDEIEGFIRSNDLDSSLTAAKLIEMVRSDALTMEALRESLRNANAALFDADIHGLEIYRTDDAGSSWRKTHEGYLRDVTYTYGYYFGEVRVAPDNPDRVFAFGVPVIYSEDGGKTFRGMNDPSVHVDHHAWWIDPRFPKRMINGNDGGIDITYNGGKTWARLDRLPVGQSYAVGVDMAEPYNIYTGLQDNGTVKCRSTAKPEDDACEFVNGGDGMHIQVDPRDPKVHYTGYQFGFYKRADGQETRPRAALGDTPLRYNWQTPILLSPHNPDILYFGANKLFRSMDRGESWTAISADLTRSTERGDVPFATLTSISESSKQFGLLYAGSDDGQLHVSRDGGASWKDIGAKLPDHWVSRVEASAHVLGRVYASLNGYRDDDMTAHVYVSEDFGGSWSRLDAGIPDAPVNVVREDPVNQNLLYVGTDMGVYVSLDRGKTWMAAAQDMPNVPVHDLVVHPRERELIAGTHGRSVYVLDVLPLQEMPAAQASAVHAFYVAPVQAGRGWRSSRSAWFYDPKNDPKATFSFWAAADGPVEVRVETAEKKPLRTLSVAATRGINVVEWDLLVDKDSALAVESAAIDAAKTSGKDSENASLRRYSESLRLGHPLYVLPGTYTMVVSAGEQSSSTELEVKPVKAPTPRTKPPAKRRGEK